MVDRQGAGLLSTTPAAPRRLVIASRESRLALWQAHHVRDRLQALYPSCQVEILGMTTEGDRVLDRALNEIGGKGLFTKELEVALADGRADLAVHSLKDVPMTLPEGFALSAVLAREDPRDAFVSNHFGGLADLPAGARVGTSSLRRGAQLRSRFPHLTILPLRGNLDTRLGKLDRGDYEAIVLAAAGLKRLGLAQRIRALLTPEESLPAAGQGALGIEIRAEAGAVHDALAPMVDATTLVCVTAERAVSRVLGGSCRVPLAAYARPRPQGGVELIARVASIDGASILESHAQTDDSSVAAAEACGELAAQRLLDQGASVFVHDLRDPDPAGPA